jgi:predicted HicB family RNase H-like nuclease
MSIAAMLLAMQQVSARVEDDLKRRVKILALQNGVTLNEVIERLLTAYAEGKIKVERRTPE